MSRIQLLLRRAWKARQLGFPFWGTRFSRFPKRAKLLGTTIPLDASGEHGCLADIINVWLDDEYGLTTLPSAPATIVDIGANLGLFSLWAAHTYPSAQIHAYEPNPRITPLTKAHLSKTGVTLFESGVGSRSGQATIRDEGDSRTVRLDVKSEGNVPVVSLSEVVKRCGGQIDLLKIDCEGGEWDLFQDANSMKQVKLIRMEYHLVSNHSLRDFLDEAERLDFHIEKLVENNSFGIAWLSNRHSNTTEA